jgi:hypothetical protein
MDIISEKDIKVKKTVLSDNVDNIPAPLTELIVRPRTRSKAKSPSLRIMMERFKRYFREDLIGHIGKRQPDFRTVTVGGYGLKTLLETKHRMYGKVQTTDCDITVSNHMSKMIPVEMYTHWVNKIYAFIRAQVRPEDFKLDVINFGRQKVPVMGFTRYYVIMIKYLGEDFVDVVISNMKITPGLIDGKTSAKAGVPVKTEEHYLDEFLSLIYIENVPGVNAYGYKKRNPVTGLYREKGVKDIERSKLLCKMQYHRYCRLLAELTVEKLESMKKSERDNYFRALKWMDKDRK